jgi:hypothetical protein
MINKVRFPYFFLVLLCSVPAMAWVELLDRVRTFQISGQVVFTQEESLRPSYPLQASLTVMPFDQRIVLGITGQYWLTPTSLKMTTLGGLLGIQWGNPRIRYRLLASTQTPLGTEEGLGKEPLWEIKIQSVLKFNRIFSWNLEAGYLYTKNVLQVWSGPVLGTGIGIHF